MTLRTTATALALPLLVSLPASQGDAQGSTNGAQISFAKTTYDYGTMAVASRRGQGELAFTNTGNAPLTVTNAAANCECLTVRWTPGPIAPGGTGQISFGYDTKRTGIISKTITVTSNANASPQVVLTIKGKVLPH